MRAAQPSRVIERRVTENPGRLADRDFAHQGARFRERELAAGDELHQSVRRLVGAVVGKR